MSIKLRDQTTLDGELIAVDVRQNGFWLLSERRGNAVGHIVSIPQRLYFVRRATIEEARLSEYRTDWRGLAGWTSLGVLSTLSHGVFLLLSAPIWTIAGSIAAAAESRAALHDFPDEPLEAFPVYARFPQGLPPGVDEAAVLHGMRGRVPAPVHPAAPAAPAAPVAPAARAITSTTTSTSSAHR